MQTSNRPGSDSARESAQEIGFTDAGDPVGTMDASDALLWLAADRGVATSDAGTVKVWADQSDWQHDATSLTLTDGPRVVEREGRAVIDFDGSAELGLPRFPALSELSFLAVVSVHAAGGDLRCASFLHLANRGEKVFQDDYIDFRRQTQEFLYQVTTDRMTVDKSNRASFSTQALHVISVVHSAHADVALRIDGRWVGGRGAALPAFVERGYNFIGNNHYHDEMGLPQCDAFNGQLGEMLLFPRALEQHELGELERELAAKWRVELW